MHQHAGRRQGATFVHPTATAAAAAHADWRVALDRVLDETRLAPSSAPDLVVLFASSAYADDYADLVRDAYRRTGARCLIGGSARGVIGGGDCYESGPSLSLAAIWLPGGTITPVRLHQSMLDALDVPEAHGRAAGLPVSGAVNGWVMIADPYRMDAQDALQRLRGAYPGVPITGAQASTASQDRRAWIFFDDHVYDEGGVALAIGGPYALEIAVSQGAEPIGDAWTVTGVDRNQITTISNRPAAEVMHETLAVFPAEIRPTIRRNLMLGFPMNEYQDSFERGQFVVRGLMGVDDDTGALLVGSIPRLGQTVQFHLRDAVNASLDVEQVLVDLRATVREREVVMGLAFTCKGRGTAMFGRGDHDVAAIRAVFPGLPLAGIFSFGEIGPVCGVPALNSFAMVLVLITRRPVDA